MTGPSCCHLAQSVSESQPGKGVTVSEAVLYLRRTDVVTNCRLFATVLPTAEQQVPLEGASGEFT